MAWMVLDTSSWRILAFVLSVPVMLTTIGAYLYVPESPRWLMMKGRMQEAEAIVRQAAKINGVDMVHITELL